MRCCHAFVALCIKSSVCSMPQWQGSCVLLVVVLYVLCAVTGPFLKVHDPPPRLHATVSSHPRRNIPKMTVPSPPPPKEHNGRVTRSTTCKHKGI